MHMPSSTSGTDDYLRYLQWSRSQLAEASVFSTEHAWGLECRTGALVTRGKRHMSWGQYEDTSNSINGAVGLMAQKAQSCHAASVSLEGDTVALVLRLGNGRERGSLTVRKNGMDVGTIVADLKPGEWCWAVEVWGEGDTVRAQWDIDINSMRGKGHD